MQLPEIGDVYETSVQSIRVLLCIRKLKIMFYGGYTFDFLVLEGSHPPIRTWSSDEYTSYSMETAMTNFKFTKIAGSQ